MNSKRSSDLEPLPSFPSTPISGCTDFLVRAPSKAGVAENREGLTKEISSNRLRKYYRSFPDLKCSITGLACMYDVTAY